MTQNRTQPAITMFLPRNNSSCAPRSARSCLHRQRCPRSAGASSSCSASRDDDHRRHDLRARIRATAFQAAVGPCTLEAARHLAQMETGMEGLDLIEQPIGQLWPLTTGGLGCRRSASRDKALCIRRRAGPESRRAPPSGRAVPSSNTAKRPMARRRELQRLFLSPFRDCLNVKPRLIGAPCRRRNPSGKTWKTSRPFPGLAPR